MACENTFARCVQQTTLKAKAEKYAGEDTNIMEQLDFIAEYYLDLKSIKLLHQENEKLARKKREEEINDIY